MQEHGPDTVRHFVQYHNPEKAGHGHVHEPSDDFLIYTNKPFPLVAATLGNRVWLICGEGRPRRYGLCSTFIVDEVGEAADPVFRWYARGAEGRAFDPPLPLDGDPWFPSFLRRHANFSLGLRELRDGDVARLQAFVSSVFSHPSSAG